LDANLNSNLNDKKGDTAIALFLFFYCQMKNNKKAKHQNAWLSKIRGLSK